MANTVLIASVTGIVVSGVVGPAATAWAARRAARKQFLRDQAAKRRDDLRRLFDEAATVLGVGPIRLRERREAQHSGAELTDEQRAWPDRVYVIGSSSNASKVCASTSTRTSMAATPWIWSCFGS